MARVLFLHDFPYRPSLERRTTIRYRAGWEGTVKRECADAAVAAGAAEEIETPPREPSK